MSEVSAQMEREVELTKDPVMERLKGLGLKAKSQGLTSEEYIKFIELLEHRYTVASPVWYPGSVDGWAEYRSGQCDLVKFMRVTLSELEYKVLEGVK